MRESFPMAMANRAVVGMMLCRTVPRYVSMSAEITNGIGAGLTVNITRFVNLQTRNNLQNEYKIFSLSIIGKHV